MFDVFDINIVLPLYDTSPHHTFIGRVNLLWNVSAAVPTVHLFFAVKELKGGASPWCQICGV